MLPVAHISATKTSNSCYFFTLWHFCKLTILQFAIFSSFVLVLDYLWLLLSYKPKLYVIKCVQKINPKHEGQRICFYVFVLTHFASEHTLNSEIQDYSGFHPNATPTEVLPIGVNISHKTAKFRKKEIRFLQMWPLSLLQFRLWLRESHHLFVSHTFSPFCR